jgi:hypothetical protein
MTGKHWSKEMFFKVTARPTPKKKKRQTKIGSLWKTKTVFLGPKKNLATIFSLARPSKKSKKKRKKKRKKKKRNVTCSVLIAFESNLGQHKAKGSTQEKWTSTFVLLAADEAVDRPRHV